MTTTTHTSETFPTLTSLADASPERIRAELPVHTRVADLVQAFSRQDRVTHLISRESEASISQTLCGMDSSMTRIESGRYPAHDGQTAIVLTQCPSCKQAGEDLLIGVEDETDALYQALIHARATLRQLERAQLNHRR